MGRLKDAVIELLSAAGWPAEEVEEQQLIRIAIEGNSGRWPCIALWNADDDQLAFYGVCPKPVPPERRTAMGELVLRANFGLPIGNFELDLDDGELRFKTSVDFEDTAIDPELLHHLFYINVAMMDQHLPALEAVIAGAGAREALARISAPPR